MIWTVSWSTFTFLERVLWESDLRLAEQVVVSLGTPWLGELLSTSIGTENVKEAVRTDDWGIALSHKFTSAVSGTNCSTRAMLLYQAGTETQEIFETLADQAMTMPFANDQAGRLLSERKTYLRNLPIPSSCLLKHSRRECRTVCYQTAQTSCLMWILIMSQRNHLSHCTTLPLKAVTTICLRWKSTGWLDNCWQKLAA